MLTIKILLILIAALFLARFVPFMIRWYKKPPKKLVERPSGMFQYAPHVALAVHIILALLVLAGINPLPFLPRSAPATSLNSPFLVSVALAGVFLFFVANLFRWQAIAYQGSIFEKDVLVRQDHHLLTGGAYRICRHPIYLGNLLAELGTAMALLYWPLAVFAVCVSFPLWNLRAAREEELLTNHYRHAYHEYMSRVKRWWLW